MPVDKNITTYGAGNHFRRKGLKGGAGGDVRGYNVRAGTVLGTAGHTYTNGGWVGANTETDAGAVLGDTHFGPPLWRSAGQYKKGDRVTVYVSGAGPREYKCIRDVGVGGTYPNVTGSAGVTHVGTATTPDNDATHWLRYDDTDQKRTRTQGGPIPGVPTGVTVGQGATQGSITVAWTNDTPDNACAYEVVCLAADYLIDSDGEESTEWLTTWIMQNTYSDANDLSGLTPNGDTYPRAGSARMTITTAASALSLAAQHANGWVVTDVVPAGHNVVVGVRTVSVADTGITRAEAGRRGPWVWAQGASTA
jgi:hypothetical protein